MEPFVWDKYVDSVRLTLAGALGVLAIILFANGLGVWAALAIIAAALAFHAQYKLSIDPQRLTYEIRTLIRPFGVPRRGSVDEIKCLLLGMYTTQQSTVYTANLVFKDSSIRPFQIMAGELGQVTDLATTISDATGIKIAEEDIFSAARRSYAAVSKLID